MPKLISLQEPKDITAYVNEELLKQKQKELSGQIKQMQVQDGALMKDMAEDKITKMNENIEYLKQNQHSPDFNKKLGLIKNSSGIIQSVDYYDKKAKALAITKEDHDL